MDLPPGRASRQAELPASPFGLRRDKPGFSFRAFEFIRLDFRLWRNLPAAEIQPGKETAA
jgi:hypothetical protein